METQIRPAEPGDLGQVMTMLRDNQLPCADITAGHLGTYLVAAHDGRAEGVVGLEIYGRAALLRSLAVDSSARGHGLGSRLVAAAESLARRQGVRTLWLLTETASHFFEQRGYATAARADAPAELQITTEFRDLCPSTAVCMRKSI